MGVIARKSQIDRSISQDLKTVEQESDKKIILYNKKRYDRLSSAQNTRSDFKIKGQN